MSEFKSMESLIEIQNWTGDIICEVTFRKSDVNLNKCINLGRWTLLNVLCCVVFNAPQGNPPF